MPSPVRAALIFAGILPLCVGCAAPETRVGEETGCLAGGCHTAVVAGPNLHLPVAAGGCGACHIQTDRNHPDEEGREFAPVQGAGPVFCFECHLERDPAPAFVHRPYGAGMCQECHENHGSLFRPLMKRDVNGLCLYCHRDLAARIEMCRFTHDPIHSETCVVTCHDPHASDVEPFLRSEDEALCRECHRTLTSCPGGEASCTSCHHVHAANNRWLLRDR